MENFEKSIEKIQNIKVIDASIPYEAYISLDLSIHSKQLSKFSPKTAEDYSPVSYTHLTLPTILRV